MDRRTGLVLFLTVALFGIFVVPARATLSYDAGRTSEGLAYIIVSGEFAYGDDLSRFTTIVRTHRPLVVSFNSPGGNVVKALELGRLIRSLGLNTFQLRGPDCASACALAFMGGVIRLAEPGAIGVHKSSFSGSLNSADAVSGVQQLTAEIIGYMAEMGVDPALLQVALQYDSDDIRYLSRSEMERFRVTTDQQEPSPPAAAQTSPSPAAPQDAPRSFDANRPMPVARSGQVRHPSGRAPLKAMPDGKSTDIASLSNRTPVAISGSADRWYRIQARGKSGYMHHTWVFVDQFEGGQFDKRHIQIKSVSTQAAAEAYARASTIPLAAYLATNGWFAITLEEMFEPETATQFVKRLKTAGSIPDDSFVVYGNTYVRKVCCN